MKVLLIVLGSLFVLALVAVVGLAMMLPRIFKGVEANSRDPVVARQTAAKIANFRLPHGYRIASATDLGLTQTIVIRPVEPTDVGFQIQLTGQHLPAGDSNTAFDTMSATLGFAAKFAHCDLRRVADDTMVVRGRPAMLRALACAGGTPPMRVEMGFVEGTAPTVQVIATDVGGHFDRDALHQLLASFR